MFVEEVGPIHWCRFLYGLYLRDIVRKSQPGPESGDSGMETCSKEKSTIQS